MVQTYEINVTKRQELNSAHAARDCGRLVVFDAKLSEFELTFSEPMYEFNTGDGD